MKKNIYPFLLSSAGRFSFKIALLGIALFGMTNPALPQEGIPSTTEQENTRKVQWGVKAGINFASLSINNSGNSNNSVSTKSITGAVGGITLDYSITPAWYLHSGLEVSMKGFKANASGGGDFKVNATYVLLPFEAGYMFEIGRSWKIEPRVGLYFAYGIAGKYGVSGSDKFKTFQDKLFKKTDYGVGVGFYAYREKFVFGLHSEIGLAKPDGENLQVSGASVHNSNIALTVGYLF